MNKLKLKEIEKAFLKASALKKTPEVVPDCWWTSEDYIKLHGVSQSTANKHIKLLLQKKQIESKKFLIACHDKALHQVPHYHLIDNNA